MNVRNIESLSGKFVLLSPIRIKALSSEFFHPVNIGSVDKAVSAHRCRCRFIWPSLLFTKLSLTPRWVVRAPTSADANSVIIGSTTTTDRCQRSVNVGGPSHDIGLADRWLSLYVCGLTGRGSVFFVSITHQVPWTSHEHTHFKRYRLLTEL